jgi:sec-independent protein translocase protein TatB
MSFSDTIFLFFLALILFGPKKLPEMARKAGKLMAELRRASNEFRSQIESEIAHLEVEKSPTVSQTPPQGTVASLSLNPVSSQVAASESSGTLAGPAPESPAQLPNATIAEPAISSTSEPPAAPVADPVASQESHV